MRGLPNRLAASARMSRDKGALICAGPEDPATTFYIHFANDRVLKKTCGKSRSF